MLLRVLVFAALLAPTLAFGQVIIGNYPPTNDTSNSAGLNDGRRKALSFTMPAGQNAVVGNVTLRLGNYDINDIVTLEIRNHTGSTTAPGTTSLVNFTSPTPGGTAVADYVFTPNNTFELLGGTSYWIYAYGATTPSAYDWRGSSPAVTPTGIASYASGSLFTTNGGSSWTNSTTLNTFQIEAATPVPEPSVVLLVAATGAAVWLRVRRRV